MKVKGIILDETNFDEIRKNGFTNFRVVDAWGEEEMDARDADAYQRWCISKQEEIENLTMDYMMGQDDAKLFFFSDKQPVQIVIQHYFPGSILVEVDDEDYPFDYDYRNKV